jgi:ABC-type bacteriocin/lantibiotic exporter with double-glycine peptidase domain
MGILDALIKGIQSGAWQIVFPLAILGLLYIYDRDKKKQIKDLSESNKARETLLMDLIEKNNEESKTREERLMDYLEKTNESHAKIANAMERLELRMEFIEKKIENN